MAQRKLMIYRQAWCSRSMASSSGSDQPIGRPGSLGRISQRGCEGVTQSSFGKLPREIIISVLYGIDATAYRSAIMVRHCPARALDLGRRELTPPGFGLSVLGRRSVELLDFDRLYHWLIRDEFASFGL